MHAICQKCKKRITGVFVSGKYHFQHCGQKWSKQAHDRGNRQVSKEGSRIGGVIGGLLGLMNGDITGSAAGVGLGKAIGSFFDSDNGIKCTKCNNGNSYPTGSSKYGKRQYQCRNVRCRAYTYR